MAREVWRYMTCNADKIKYSGRDLTDIGSIIDMYQGIHNLHDLPITSE